MALNESQMTFNEWVDYREGLREYLVFDRSMDELSVLRITHEIAQCNTIIDSRRSGKIEKLTTGEIKKLLKNNQAK